MKSRTLFLMAMALVVGLASCKKDDPSLLKPTLVSETKDIHSTYAEFTWSIEFPGMFESGVELSLNENMSDSILYQGTQSNNTFKVTIENLMPATKYYFRYVVWNPVRRDELGISSFMTEAGVPQPTTDVPTNVTQSSVTLGGVVSNDGGTAITACGICWGTEPEPTIADNHIDIDATMEHFAVEVTGLIAETKYYVRTYATNRMGTGYGNEVTFFTGDVVLPQVVTVEVKDVEWTTAVGVGEVTSDGGGEVVERGFCWSTSPYPEYSGAHLSSGTGTGAFTVNLTGLNSGTTYHVRAYAINSVGTAYGEDQTFTTFAVPTGAICGLFSVSESEKVYFSQGNLQYRASDGKWQFAEHQYDCIGDANSNISSSYNGWIDLFGWGTSGWNSGAVCYQPWSTSESSSDYYPGGSYTNNLTGDYANADWGVYNAISNGGDQAGLWRTLTKDEWVYVFNRRSTSSGIRYAKACVNNVNGVILLPDDWSESYYSLSGPNSSYASYTGNTITVSQWTTLEQHGAVFLPFTGIRHGTWVFNVWSGGYYWSASYYNEYCAYEVWFYGSDLGLGQNGSSRDSCHSVRLVRSAQY